MRSATCLMITSCMCAMTIYGGALLFLQVVFQRVYGAVPDAKDEEAVAALPKARCFPRTWMSCTERLFIFSFSSLVQPSRCMFSS